MNFVAEKSAARTLLDGGDPAQDNRAFRRCLGTYPTGVTVVTASAEGRPVGMAVNSFAAVSLDPPLVLWSIRRESKSLPDFLEASHFAVNILAADQVETSQLFGAGHPERFEQTPWHRGVCGAPLLDHAIAHLECRKTLAYEGGDHLILIGHVERYARFEGTPLLFSQGQYAVSQSHPHLTALATTATATAAAASPEEADRPSLLTVLSQTQQRMSALFEDHRRDLGVTQASTRILMRLAQGACNVEELERATYLGRHALEDALADLATTGLALRDAQDVFTLTPEGRLKREAVAARSAQFTQEKLQGMTASDIEATQRVLAALQRR